MLEEKVRKLIAEKLGMNQPEAAFLEDLGMDSLDLVELIMTMEDEFGINIPDDEVEEIRTVQGAVNYIQTHSEKGS
jgi:acyl carrier protein